jgi:hypothetical protein
VLDEQRSDDIEDGADDQQTREEQAHPPALNPELVVHMWLQRYRPAIRDR